MYSALVRLDFFMEKTRSNKMNPDQTAPMGVVLSGFILFAM